jgi:hypothetical protein
VCVQEPCVYLISAASVMIGNNNNSNEMCTHERVSFMRIPKTVTHASADPDILTPPVILDLAFEFAESFPTVLNSTLFDEVQS